MRVIWLFALMLLVLPLVSADVYEAETNISLTQSCYNNGTYCSGSAVCNISVFSPTGEVLVNNLEMTNQNAFFNYTLSDSNTSEFGDYEYRIMCEDSGLSNFGIFAFEVTPSGTSPTTAHAIFYVIAFIFSIVFFLLALLGGIKLPWKNNYSEDGYLVNISDLKYLKLFCWFFAYICLIWLAWLGRAVNNMFLFVDAGTGVFDGIFYFLMAFFVPVFFLVAFVGFVRYINDKKFQNLLGRGVKVR
jgi:hypothetical protein